MTSTIYKEHGFDSDAEFYSMIASVDFSTQEAHAAFKDWQSNDGSKFGLALLIEPLKSNLAKIRIHEKRRQITEYLRKYGQHDVVIAAYGRGVNSTAFLIEMVKRGERIDAILSADTGDEYEESYEYERMFSKWLVSKGYPPVTVVRKGGRQETLYENCIRMKMLPSLAYGMKGCSHKFKIEPQEKWCNNYLPAQALWACGGKVTKIIGYDLDEPHRANIPEDAKYRYRYPCIEFGWGRDECEDRIVAEGLPVPRGSSCWHCPAHTKAEILEQSKTHPWHTGRVMFLEALAAPNLGSVKGMGRRFSWTGLITGSEPPRGNEMPPEPCGSCYDGCKL